MFDMNKLGQAAQNASRILATTSTEKKNAALLAIADAIRKRKGEWLAANAEDIASAKASGMRLSLLDRLTLTESRIDSVVNGILEAVALPDPVGETLKTTTRPNGLRIVRKRVPLGVIGIIYEARPNVTVDAAVLCLKAGNACILRGGKEAISSNRCITGIMQEALASAGLPESAVSLITDTSRDSAKALMHLNQYIDVLIPRGGAGLIRTVVAESTVPVIRTGEGVCHIYVDETADLNMAASVLFNAKCSRPSVCNAVECVLVNSQIASAFFEKAIPLLDTKAVELRADARALSLLGDRAKAAAEEDWDTEYGDQILAVRIVDTLEEAIDFITLHGTQHSECIMTSSPESAEAFLNRIDAAAVYVNASTRFTDGGEFGLGAEIGISTQKLHARGPMGLEELTSYKYVVYGDGQIR